MNLEATKGSTVDTSAISLYKLSSGQFVRIDDSRGVAARVVSLHDDLRHAKANQAVFAVVAPDFCGVSVALDSKIGRAVTFLGRGRELGSIRLSKERSAALVRWSQQWIAGEALPWSAPLPKEPKMVVFGEAKVKKPMSTLRFFGLVGVGIFAALAALGAAFGADAPAKPATVKTEKVSAGNLCGSVERCVAVDLSGLGLSTSESIDECLALSPDTYYNSETNACVTPAAR